MLDISARGYVKFLDGSRVCLGKLYADSRDYDHSVSHISLRRVSMGNAQEICSVAPYCVEVAVSIGTGAFRSHQYGISLT